MIVDSDQSLRTAIEDCLQCEAVALDTEFVWERTFYPHLGLIQIGLAEDRVYLVDTLKIQDFSPLAKLIADPKVTKILHDALQDLIILHRATGALPRNVFDSRLAAGFVGYGSTLSLRDLIRHTLDIDIPKDQTRSNWVKRPLTDKQLQYARDDVRYLVSVRELILQKALKSKRTTWIAEEMATFEQAEHYADDSPEELFLRIKGRGRLRRDEQGVLMRLAVLRDEIAKELNRPRSHVLKDEVLVEICVRKPSRAEKLEAIPGFDERLTQRFGARILQAVQDSIAVLPSFTPRSEIENENQSACVDFVMACIKGKSLSENLDPGLIATRSHVTELVCQMDLEKSRLYQGWRGEFIGEDVRRILRGEVVVRIDPKTKIPVVVE